MKDGSEATDIAAFIATLPVILLDIKVYINITMHIDSLPTNKDYVS